MTNPKEALEWYERKQVEARAMADRDCNNCKHHKADGCSRWDCEYEPKDMVEVVRCKDCKYFEYNHTEVVDGVPLILAHEICAFWGGGSKTSENGYCSFGERREP